MTSTTEVKTSAEAPHRAGAFDIRAFIALLIGIYGVVLLVAGIIGPDAAELKKTGGMNINLYAGIGMIVVAAAFLSWARMRPVVVPEHPEQDAETDAPQGTEPGRAPLT